MALKVRQFTVVFESTKYRNFVNCGVCILNTRNLVGNSDFQSTSESRFDLAKQPSFNYQNLDRQTQIAIKQKTSEIKSLIRQTAQDIFYVGQKLAEVKQQLKHGEFRNWLNTEFNWSVSSATKFMQVSEQFKSVNFTHLNFATSALYVLAAPSTPEKARQHALQLASKGENITYSLAKLIIKHHKESALDEYLPEISTTESERSNTCDTSAVSDADAKANARLSDRSVRIVKIKQEKPKSTADKIQDFEIIYAGVRIAVEGSPQDLTILFEKMQNNPQFAEDVFRQAKSLSVSNEQ